MLYPVNPCSLAMIHGNELRQLHLITGAPHCVNPSLIKLLGVCMSIHGKDLRTSYCESFYAYAWNPWSFVIHMGMNYVKFT